ncbi:MAG: hypothetical protein ACLTSL_18160 [Odoribacter splanchnicus]
MKKSEISSLILLIISIIVGVNTKWCIGIILFVIGAILINKFIGFPSDESDSSQATANKKSGRPSNNKIAWDFYLSKSTVLSYVERYFNYFENKFYRSDDWPNIYRLDDYYKNMILVPFRELLVLNTESLKFIEYEGGDFYIGQADNSGNRHGTGLYHWARTKDAEGDKHNEMFVGQWNHGQRTKDGSYIHASDDTKTWFEACSEGFRIAPIYGLRR